MPPLIRIKEPQLRPAPVKASWDAFVSMAFRPFYLLAAMQGIVAILAWGLGYGGTRALPSFLWHGHEMVWGYAGAVIVGFVLTAAATWTGQAPLRGAPLAGLAALWLAAPGGPAGVAGFQSAGRPAVDPVLRLGGLGPGSAGGAQPECPQLRPAPPAGGLRPCRSGLQPGGGRSYRPGSPAHAVRRFPVHRPRRGPLRHRRPGRACAHRRCPPLHRRGKSSLAQRGLAPTRHILLHEHGIKKRYRTQFDMDDAKRLLKAATEVARDLAQGPAPDPAEAVAPGSHRDEGEPLMKAALTLRPPQH